MRNRLIEALAGNTFPGARGDSLRIFDGKELKAKTTTVLADHGDQAAKISGQSASLVEAHPPRGVDRRPAARSERRQRLRRLSLGVLAERAGADSVPADRGEAGGTPPEDLDSFIAWLRAVAKDDVRYIVLQRGAAVGK